MMHTLMSQLEVILITYILLNSFIYINTALYIFIDLKSAKQK